MEIHTIALFFFYIWGLGFTLLKIFKVTEATFLERQIMRTGIGISTLILIALFLNIFNIPLDWRIFLFIAASGPVFYLIKNRKKIALPKKDIKLKISKSTIFTAAVLLIFLASLHMYSSGAFKYPWLENDDPWSHAAGIKYVSSEKTFDASPYKGFPYMNPYPPSYDFIFALLHQTQTSLYWLIKFVNALIVSLSIIYFAFFAKEFFKDQGKAIFATATLAAIPAYLSHFIWAPALAMCLFFPALYTLEMTKKDKRWRVIAALSIGGLLVAHPTHTLTLFALILIYLGVRALAERKFSTPLVTGVGGVLISLSWWAIAGKNFFVRNLYYGFNVPSALAEQQNANILVKVASGIAKVFPKWSGTASRPYTFDDFFIAKGQNLINNPVGIGVVAFLLFLVGLVVAPLLSIKQLSLPTRITLIGATSLILTILLIIVKSNGLAFIAIYTALMVLILLISGGWKDNQVLFISLSWFFLTFLIVNNLTFDIPFGFFAFRTWMILAIPLVLIATEGLWSIFRLLPLRGSPPISIAITKTAIVLILLIGIAFTSAQQKYEVNTATWPPGAFWTSIDEVQAYVWLKTLPPDTKVFSYITGDQVIGMDKFSCDWCQEIAEYQQHGFNETAQQNAQWLKKQGYSYLIIGGREARQFGQQQLADKLKDIGQSGVFEIAYQTQGAIVLRVI